MGEILVRINDPFILCMLLLNLDSVRRGIFLSFLLVFFSVLCCIMVVIFFVVIEDGSQGRSGLLWFISPVKSSIFSFSGAGF